VRIGSAVATGSVLLIAATAAAFGVDYLGDLRSTQRAVVLVAIVASLGWAAKRLVVPLLHVRETETDLALLVGRQRGLDGDLVAALQFQAPEAIDWGSPQLERAVIGEVDEASRELSVFDGFTWKPLPARLGLFGVALAAVVVLSALFPRHASAFLRRLSLADTTYPTRTVITSIAINGKAIDLDDDGPLSAPAGAPLAFTVAASGARPAGGDVLLASDGGGRTVLALKADRSSSFSGVLATFTEPVTFVVRLGDAKIPGRRIDVVPLSSVTLDLKPVPPAYARANAPAPPPPGVRTAFVLEGSDVELVVKATNKPLDRVTLSVTNSIGERREQQGTAKNGPTGEAKLSHTVMTLRPSADRKTWTLAPAGTLFEAIRAPIDFTVSAIDADGLSPEPLKGSIRLRADRPPRVAAGAVVRRVLPAGRPELTYGAADDYGVKAVVAKVTATRADGKVEERTVPLPVPRYAVTEINGHYPLDLSGFGLEKGDTVAVIVEATDARGNQPGEAAAAEPITFEVTDREGLIAGLRETDEEGAERLDEIIRRELGIGGER
jgi:hypothetical protein